MTEFQVGVKAVILHEGKMLLIKRSDRYGSIAGIWDIPGGRIDFGEEPEEGLRREIEEETGITNVKIDRVLDASTVFKDENRQIIRITYLCSVLSEKIRLSSEHIELIWIRPSEIDFEIKDRLVEKVIKANFI